MAASDTTTVATSCGQSELNVADLLGFSLCVPLLDNIVRQLLTHPDWYQFYFSSILGIATLQFILNPCLCCYLSYGHLDMMQLIL
jgi:hypothetical protein